MRTTVRFLSLLLVALALATTATAGDYALTEEEYEIYCEVAEYLCTDWDTPLLDLLDDIAYLYGVNAQELYEFMQFAALVDSDHVWIPVKGGSKFHAVEACSKMVEPRPVTKDIAYDFGFTPCKRCDPGA